MNEEAYRILNTSDNLSQSTSMNYDWKKEIQKFKER
jgi:hypothetical protein